MAVLRQQRAAVAVLFERGLVDEEEREELDEAVSHAMRHLDMAGEWRLGVFRLGREGGARLAAPALGWQVGRDACTEGVLLDPTHPTPIHHTIIIAAIDPATPTPPHPQQAPSGARRHPSRWFAAWMCLLPHPIASSACCCPMPR